MLRRIVQQFFAAAAAMAVTFLTGNWAVQYAYERRGYQAAGGAYLFIPVVYFGVYTAVGFLSEWIKQQVKEQG